ncbi:MAG: hypothetical protein Q9170_004619 [Blastenia crenularia]
MPKVEEKRRKADVVHDCFELPPSSASPQRLRRKAYCKVIYYLQHPPLRYTFETQQSFGQHCNSLILQPCYDPSPANTLTTSGAWFKKVGKLGVGASTDTGSCQAKLDSQNQIYFSVITAKTNGGKMPLVYNVLDAGLSSWKSDNDPREERVALDNAEAHPDRLPSRPPHHINPWARDPPGSDNGNIEHVEWNPSPRLHFSRTSYRSTSPRGGFLGQPGNDPLASLFQNMFDTRPVHAQHTGSPRPGNPFPTPFSAPPNRTPWHAYQPQFPESQRNQPGFGGRNSFTSTTGVWPTPPSPTNTGNNHLQEVMQALFQNIGQTSDTNAPHAGGPRPTPGFPGLHQLFASVLNPANAAHGDVVYSEEALDRIISQFMEGQTGSSAPGPASAAAIEALPKKKVEKDMLGSDGKAECSVCMDNVEIGDEITVLPCQHWFHGDCVGAWLKEHDTCPHCRQGIMPKDAPNEATSPRSPGQEPRTSLPPLSSPAREMPGGFHFRYQSGGNGHSPTGAFRSQRDLQVPSPRTERRRSSGSSGRNAGEGNSGGGFSSAIGGWVRNHWGGGGGGSHDQNSSR